MLTLKQARRMVAKSRRRVWRLLGYEPMGRTGHALARAEAAAVSGPHRKAAGLLADELGARWDRLQRMEIAAHARKWTQYCGLPILPGDFRVGPDLIEVYTGPGDGSDDIHPCPACGAEMECVECHECGGEGGRDGESLQEEDPLWYDLDDYEVCGECNGEGYYWQCPNAPHGEDTTMPNTFWRAVRLATALVLPLWALIAVALWWLL